MQRCSTRKVGLLLGMLSLGAAACGDDFAPIRSGRYEAWYLTRSDNSTVKDLGSAAMEIDRDNEEMRLWDTDGSQITGAIRQVALDDPPTGCPTMYTQTELEILAVDLPSVEVAGVTFDSPHLVADCGGSIMLRDGRSDLSVSDCGPAGEGYPCGAFSRAD
jgi:hypothetical protein